MPKPLLQTQPTSNLYAWIVPIKCYQCNLPKHCSNECPQRCLVNIVDKVGEEGCEELEDQEERDEEEIFVGVIVVDMLIVWYKNSSL